MKHRGRRRRLLAGAMCVSLGTAVAGAGAGVAPAAAQDPAVELVTVTGPDLAEPLEVPAEQYPDLCAALYREVSWLVDRQEGADEPDPDTLGPEYALVAHVDGQPRHRFQLYPEAEGGPRVFRPAEQPGDREVDEAWFLGRVTMAETLAAVGVPPEGDSGVPVLPGGAGGGAAAPEATADSDRGALAVLRDWREGMLLTAAITVAIVVALGGVALLIRRRV